MISTIPNICCYYVQTKKKEVMKSSNRDFSYLRFSNFYQKTSCKDNATVLRLYNFSSQLSQHLFEIWLMKFPTERETISCCAETSAKKNALIFKNRLQILLLIISGFKRINSVLFDLKSPENFSSGNHFMQNRSSLIRLNLLNIRHKIWRQFLSAN